MNHTIRSIIEAELEKAVLAEREACAALVDEIGEIYISEGAATLGLFLYIGAAIRARGGDVTDNN